jgi:hypothetical protein
VPIVNIKQILRYINFVLILIYKKTKRKILVVATCEKFENNIYKIKIYKDDFDNLRS